MSVVSSSCHTTRPSRAVSVVTMCFLLLSARDRLLLRRDLFAQARLLRLQFGRELLAEICGLEQLADFDLGAAVEWCALQPLDRLVHRVRLPQPEARDEFFGIRERAVDDGALASGELHAL